MKPISEEAIRKEKEIIESDLNPIAKPKDGDVKPKERKAAPKLKLEELEVPSVDAATVVDKPPDYDIENTIFIKGIPVEIKPTKLLYFRNGATDCFAAIRAIPINELLKLPAGIVDKKYSGDELVYRFLYAVFDGNVLFKKNYNDISAGDIEKAVDIFGRLNGIFKREEEAKKKQAAQAQTTP